MRRAMFVVITGLGLTGCVAPVPPPETDPVVNAVAAPFGNQMPVSVIRAIALFDAVCGATLPGFNDASQQLVANGITIPSPEGTATLFSATEDVSFQIQDGPGQGRTCSMVFGTPDSPQTVGRGFAGLGQFVETPFGPGTLYRDTDSVVLIGASSVQGTTTYLNLRLLSER